MNTLRTPLRSRPFLPALLPIIGILLVGGAIYSNTLRAPFQWDEDRFMITPVVTEGLPAEAVRRDTELYAAVVARPVSIASFALNYRLHGRAVEGYHVFNLAVHLLNGLLVYALVLLLFRTPFLWTSRIAAHGRNAALAVSVLFTVHPIQTMAVTYIWQRMTSLAALFSLLAIVLYTAARLLQNRIAGGPFRGPVLVVYGSSLVSLILAMKTKETAFTAPFLIAALELFFMRSASRTRLIMLAPVLLTLAVIPVTYLTRLPDTWLHPLVSSGMPPRSAYFWSQLPVILMYLRLLVLPVGQNIDHHDLLATSPFEPAVAASALALLGLLAIAVHLVRRSRSGEPGLRLLSFGIIWFFCTISVDSSVFPLFQLSNEYRVYLPSVGALLALVAGLFLAADRVPFSDRTRLYAVMAVLALFGTAFAATAYQRNELWNDRVALWGDAAAKSPRKASARNGLGVSYAQAERYEEAIVEFRQAMALDPRYVSARLNLAAACLATGRVDEAIDELNIAVSLRRANPDAHLLLAKAYLERQRFQEAAEEFEEARSLAPYLEEAWAGAAFARDMQRAAGRGNKVQAGP